MNDKTYTSQKIHLTEIEKPSNMEKHVEIDARPVSVGQVSLIPYRFYLRCPLVDGKKSSCSHTDNCELYKFSKEKEKVYIHEVSKSDPRIIDLYKKSDKEIKTALSQGFPCQVSEYFRTSQTREPDLLAVREVVFYPSAKIIEKGAEHSLIDESGNPYRSQRLFSISEKDDLLSTSSVQKISGKVHPHPRNQVPTVSILGYRNSEDDFRSFKLTPEVGIQLQIFKTKGIAEFAKALSSMTRIYDRDMTHLLLLLVLHSALSFKFEGDQIKGTVDGLLIGDAGTGKTKILRTLIKIIKLGQFMTGSCSSRTGLSYAVTQSPTSSGWEIEWGAYPQNDMGLLVVDEGQDLGNEDWEKLSVARSEGVITVDRAAKGEHPARTRLIVSANPKFGRQIDSEVYPCVHAKLLFTAKDIRRFDFAQSLGLADVRKDVFVSGVANHSQESDWLTPELVRNSVLFAWTRKSDQIQFQDGIAMVVAEQSGALFEAYGAAQDIPFVTSDIRNKVLRLAVAHAIANHKVDATGENILVEAQDVIAVASILHTIYSNSNFGLKTYANLMRDETDLSPQEFATIMVELFPIGNIDIGKRNSGIINFLMRNPEITGHALGIGLDFDRKTIALHMEPYKKHGLVTAKRGAGYKTSKKFSRFMKQLEASGYDLTHLAKV